MSKNIYTILKKINFDKRVDKEIEIIKKCEGEDNFNIIVSPFVFKNFCFGLVRDFYDNVLEENFILEDKISILNDKLKTAVIALEQYSCRDNWKSEEINGYFEEDSVFGSCGYSIAENALKNIKENKYGLQTNIQRPRPHQVFRQR